jgi:hypothetical protein
MTAPNATAATPRRRRKPWLLLALLPVAPIAVGWWLTEPLDDRPVNPPPRSAESSEPLARIPDTPTAWPEGTLSGDPAKQFLLASAVRSARELDRIAGYTATFRKQERISGKLGPEQSMAMKVRNRPFAIYLKFLTPRAGKEVVYAEGHHDNKLIAHSGDWTRRLVPRLALQPDSAVALADNRHPVTEAGLVNLAQKLSWFRELDAGDDDAQTILDRITGPDGKPRYRSIHTHPLCDGRRPFARVEVLYDPETQYPIQITSYDWPAPGRTGDLELAERYIYEDLKLGVPLTAADFDPTNPDYAFMRF